MITIPGTVDTKIDPSLHERQRKLKRARIADDLNDKLSHRPGPLELVQGNILQTDNETFKTALQGILSDFILLCLYIELKNPDCFNFKPFLG